jgi:hypothetical protein
MKRNQSHVCRSNTGQQQHWGAPEWAALEGDGGMLFGYDSSWRNKFISHMRDWRTLQIWEEPQLAHYRQMYGHHFAFAGNIAYVRHWERCQRSEIQIESFSLFQS